MSVFKRWLSQEYFITLALPKLVQKNQQEQPILTYMAYNEKLADRIRGSIAHHPNVEEKKMFRGLTFMVDGKMCVCVSGEELMCRFDPALHEMVAESNGFRTMMMKGRELKGYGYIDGEQIKSKKEFEFWINLCLEFNSNAKAVKKKNKPKGIRSTSK